jgi:hypothetical protein
VKETEKIIVPFFNEHALEKEQSINIDTHAAAEREIFAQEKSQIPSYMVLTPLNKRPNTAAPKLRSYVYCVLFRFRYLLSEIFFGGFLFGGQLKLSNWIFTNSL